MSWESVKAFCRRQTQALGERYRNTPKTEDTTVDSTTNLVEEFQRVSKATVLHMELLTRLWSETISTFDKLQADWDKLSANVEELGVYSKRIEMVSTDLKKRVGDMATQFGSCIEPMRRFEHDCNGLSSLITDRKAKKLEYDFFKNKVAGLKAAPPADTARIPRNEAREADWKKMYDDANDKVKQVAQSLLGNGSKCILQSAGVICQEQGKMFDDAGKTSRAVLLQQAPGQQVAAAMQNAQATVAQRSASYSPAQAATTTTTTTTTPSKAPAPGPPPRQEEAFPPVAATSPNFNQDEKKAALPRSNSNAGGMQTSAASQRRFGGDDDPFKV